MPKISDERLEAMQPLFEAHRREPDVSVAGLLMRRMAELAEVVLPRTRVYLDTRYWIFLRDALLGRAAHPLHTELLDRLNAGVADGRLLCPINESTLFELTRQRDYGLLRASARLMDSLSRGVVIQNTPDRVRTEVRNFLIQTVGTKQIPGAPLSKVWLKVGHVIGTPVITAEGLDPVEELVAQKAFLDFLWHVTLEEMLTDTAPPPDRRPHEEAVAREMTRDSEMHESEMRSFVTVYEAELAGFWDVYETCIQDALLSLFQITNPDAPEPTEALLAEQVRLYKNALRNIIRLDKAGSSLPTAQVIAGLHAIIRWNRNRGFRATDSYDFHHAAAAVPYCDIFLTERFLANILKGSPLSFAKRFGTRIAWREEEALELLAA